MDNLVTQADLAAEIGCSVMTVSRIRRAMFLVDTRINDQAATMIFVAFELQKIGVNASRACELAARFASEIRYAAGGEDRRAWLTFIEDDRHDFVVPSLTGRHLEAVIAAHPLSIVLPLHECVARAVERLATMKSRRVAA